MQLPSAVLMSMIGGAVLTASASPTQPGTDPPEQARAHAPGTAVPTALVAAMARGDAGPADWDYDEGAYPPCSFG